MCHGPVEGGGVRSQAGLDGPRGVCSCPGDSVIPSSGAARAEVLSKSSIHA